VQADGLPRYTLWGSLGTADCLTDLLQGEIGNCGILSAIDALAHAHPEGLLGGVVRVHVETDSKLTSAANVFVQTRLFEPNSGMPFEWSMEFGSLGGDGIKQGALAADLDVAQGTAVPRYARTLSSRVWGVLLERAMADIAGGYDQLGECEPNLAWFTLIGSSADCRRYWYQPSQDRWLLNLPDLLKNASPTSNRSHKSLNAKSNSWRASSWCRAKRWQVTTIKMSSADIDTFVEEAVADGMPLCVHPVSAMEPSKEEGEPCMPLEVSFAEMLSEAPSINSQDSCFCKAHTFALGHCYSIRAAVRLQASQELWVRLRDPRRSRLFWARWDSVVHAGEVSCFLYSCEGVSSKAPTAPIPPPPLPGYVPPPEA